MCINTRAVESLSISIALSKRSSLRVREAVRCWWESLSLSRFRISVGWPFCLQPSHRISDVYSRALADRAVPSVPYFRYFESLPASSRIQLPRRQISPQSRKLFRLERIVSRASSQSFWTRPHRLDRTRPHRLENFWTRYDIISNGNYRVFDKLWI